ncbi:hypothetical protein Sfum_1689 [Syntrophobacter fumaroxidans MPOB]|uniref:Uncharacterized protein n=1 Tax=Syntrophobacter fumaroxidans (strain DSM 10017 / MPOB) TaxID=335543 RepID=A0LIX4_SYNFM|nr:hypothetical protein Sfum_1689 [Syntrophobacter fumaroxidans MPOB]
MHHSTSVLRTLTNRRARSQSFLTKNQRREKPFNGRHIHAIPGDFLDGPLPKAPFEAGRNRPSSPRQTGGRSRNVHSRRVTGQVERLYPFPLQVAVRAT